jgi:hypothetical protein
MDNVQNCYSYINIYVAFLMKRPIYLDQLEWTLMYAAGCRRSRLSEKQSFASTFQGVYCILYFDRYKFRPSLAIIKWNTQYNIQRSYYSYNGSFVCCTLLKYIFELQVKSPYQVETVPRHRYRVKVIQTKVIMIPLDGGHSTLLRVWIVPI